jgi:hypothetical protein
LPAFVSGAYVAMVSGEDVVTVKRDYMAMAQNWCGEGCLVRMDDANGMVYFSAVDGKKEAVIAPTKMNYTAAELRGTAEAQDVQNAPPGAAAQTKAAPDQAGEAGAGDAPIAAVPGIESGAAVVEAAGLSSSVLEVPVMYSGLKIYPLKVNFGGEEKNRWAVQTISNAEREKNGERQLGGDPISETLEGAKALVDGEIESEKQLVVYRAEMAVLDEKRRQSDAVAQAKKDANKGLTIAERSQNATLDKPTKLHPNAGLGMGTRRESMQKAVEQGRRIAVVMVPDTAAKKRDENYTASRRNLPTGNLNYPGVKEYLEAVARKLADDYEKPDYRVYMGEDDADSYYEISKTEFDYANSLMEKKEDVAHVEPAQLAIKNIAVVDSAGDAPNTQKDGDCHGLVRSMALDSIRDRAALDRDLMAMGLRPDDDYIERTYGKGWKMAPVAVAAVLDDAGSMRNIPVMPDSTVVALAAITGRMASMLEVNQAAMVEALTAKPAPIELTLKNEAMRVTVEQPASIVNVNLPEQPAPVVHVTNEVPAAQVVVNGPAQSIAEVQRDPRTQEILRTVTTHIQQETV